MTSARNSFFLRRFRPAGFLVLTVCAVCLLGGCAGSEEEQASTETTESTTAETKPSAPTGGDYHSTVIRARQRTLDRAEEIQNIRKEQEKEEQAFHQK